MARTDTLGNFLTDVADAIRAKKGTSETIQASDFDTEIENLPSGGGKYTPYYLSFSSLRDIYKTATQLDYEVANVDISNITNLQSMFRNCNQLTHLDLSSWDTSNVTNMSGMFTDCSALLTLIIKDFNISNVSTFASMFVRCTSLTSLDLSGWENGNDTEAYYMFGTCSALMFLDMRKFDFTKIKSGTTNGMFENVPTNCEIIVKDQTQKDWFATKFSTLTNVKTVAEYEASV